MTPVEGSIAARDPTSEELEALARLLAMQPRGAVQSMVAGLWPSRMLGRGPELEELREFDPGDDPRDIDWRSSARLGRMVVRRSLQQRSAAVQIVFDGSASMQAGGFTRVPRNAGALIAGVVAFVAAGHGDLVGLLLATDRVERTIPVGTGTRQARRIVSCLAADLPCREGTRLSVALDRILSLGTYRSTVVLVSDFQVGSETDRGFAASLARCVLEHDVIPVWLRSGGTGAVPRGGLLRAFDPEVGVMRLVDTVSAVSRARGEAASAAHDAWLTALFRRYSLAPLILEQETDVVGALAVYLGRRARRVR